MFDNLLGICKRGSPVGDPGSLDKDQIAAMLHADPNTIQEFERAYAKASVDDVSDNLFQINSRQAAEHRRIGQQTRGEVVASDSDEIRRLQERIVAELLSKTQVYTFDGQTELVRPPLALPGDFTPVSSKELAALPVNLRPELTGSLMKRDMEEPAYQSLLFFYDQFLHGRHEKQRKAAYDTFRQGLDVLDLDPITYEILGMNRNSMGHWFPQLVRACTGQSFFKLPATSIVKVPMTLLQLTRQPYESLTETTLGIVDQWAYQAFHLDEGKEYFIKTGTYSSKFDFRNARVSGQKEVRELGEYLLYIHYQALCMAHYTVQPRPIYGASTTNEWVVREFIPDKEHNPCIYHGLPLHTEYRLFVDCDSDKVLGIAPYWEPNTMKQRFGREGNVNNIHQMHDYVIYRAHEDILMRRFYAWRDKVVDNIQALLGNLDLSGQWSIDIMQNDNDFWLIDMALAEQSFFYDTYVPPHLRCPSKENWLPELPGQKRKE